MHIHTHTYTHTHTHTHTHAHTHSQNQTLYKAITSRWACTVYKYYCINRFVSSFCIYNTNWNDILALITNQKWYEMICPSLNLSTWIKGKYAYNVTNRRWFQHEYMHKNCQCQNLLLSLSLPLSVHQCMCVCVCECVCVCVCVCVQASVVQKSNMFSLLTCGKHPYLAMLLTWLLWNCVHLVALVITESFRCHALCLAYDQKPSGSEFFFFKMQNKA